MPFLTIILWLYLVLSVCLFNIHYSGACSNTAGFENSECCKAPTLDDIEVCGIDVDKNEKVVCGNKDCIYPNLVSKVV